MSAQILTDRSRAYLLALTVILGIVVEVIVLGDYLYHRQGLDSFLICIGGTSELLARNPLLDDDRRAFREGEPDRLRQILSLADLGDPEA